MLSKIVFNLVQYYAMDLYYLPNIHKNPFDAYKKLVGFLEQNGHPGLSFSSEVLTDDDVFPPWYNNVVFGLVRVMLSVLSEMD